MHFITDVISLHLTLLLHCSLPIKTVLARMGQLASALAYVHEQGIVHQDLHASNILQTLDGADWRLTDFGNAARMTQEDGSPTRLSSSMYAFMTLPGLHMMQDVALQHSSEMMTLGPPVLHAQHAMASTH